MATIAVCCYFVARSLTSYLAVFFESSSPSIASVAPLSPPADSLEMVTSQVDDYKVILDRDLFTSADIVAASLTSPEDLPVDESTLTGPAQKTSLDIKLIGTLVVGDGIDRRSSATITGGKDAKGPNVYFAGEKADFATNAKITKISKDRVEFIYSGRLEFVEIEDLISKSNFFVSAEEKHGTGSSLKGDGNSTSEGSKFVVDQKEVDDALQNLVRLQDDIKLTPSYRDNKIEGFKVISVKPGSVVSKLGLKRGDLLMKVNGQDLDMKMGLDLFNQMKDMKNFSLEINRGGRNQTLEYEIH